MKTEGNYPQDYIDKLAEILADFETILADCAEAYCEMATGEDEAMHLLHLETLTSDLERQQVVSALLGYGPEQSDRWEQLANIGKTYAGRVREFAPIVAVIMTEAWMATPTAEEWESEDFVRPADRPDRREVLVCSAMAMDGTEATKVFSIIRNDGNIYPAPMPEDMPEVAMKNKTLPGFWVGYIKELTARQERGKHQSKRSKGKTKKKRRPPNYPPI